MFFESECVRIDETMFYYESKGNNLINWLILDINIYNNKKINIVMVHIRYDSF